MKPEPSLQAVSEVGANEVDQIEGKPRGLLTAAQVNLIEHGSLPVTIRRLYGNSQSRQTRRSDRAHR
jgi:hypothetical protein